MPSGVVAGSHLVRACGVVSRGRADPSIASAA